MPEQPDTRAEDIGKLIEEIAALRAERDKWIDRFQATGPAFAALREALAWYGEQARLARLIHREGDAGRQALANDGGKRARNLLETKTDG